MSLIGIISFDIQMWSVIGPDVVVMVVMGCDMPMSQHGDRKDVVDSNSFPWWKPSLTVKLMERWDGC